MLVLTRRVGEKIVIGNEVVIEVLSVSGEDVRLGVTAPRDTSVHRHEVFEEIQAANRAAALEANAHAPGAAESIAARLRDLRAGDSEDPSSSEGEDSRSRADEDSRSSERS